MIALFIGLHVLLGSLAVVGMVTAWTTKKGSLWHRRGGKAYTLGMAGAIGVSFVVSIATQNVFLFFVGLFSAYLVYTGYRLAVAQDSVRSRADRWVARVVFAIGLFMIAYAAVVFRSDVSMAIILTVFGAIALAQAYSDHRRGRQWPTGKERIVLHLERMGGASIATVTAVFVVNVQTNPAFVAWLLPSVVGGILISYFTGKTRQPPRKARAET